MSGDVWWWPGYGWRYEVPPGPWPSPWPAIWTYGPTEDGLAPMRFFGDDLPKMERPAGEWWPDGSEESGE